MRIGVPVEIKADEYRVGLVPSSVAELVHHGHQILVQKGAGDGIGIADDAYRQAGAEIVPEAKDVFQKAEMIVKVKEPQPSEYQQLRSEHLLFTYLHLAADKPQTEGLLKSGCTAIAYETITNDEGGLPLLAPMSEVAGRIAVHVGAQALHRPLGGRGVLLGGVAGVLPGQVLILGAGVVGANAARMAMGIGADVIVLDKDIKKLTLLDSLYGARLKTKYSTLDAIAQLIQESDLVVGAVLVPGASAPKLVNREHLKTMRKGAVLVDVAIDQGGCFETSHPTTHHDPTYVIDDIVHYCVANMPGAVARSSTFALNNATLPYVIELANQGWQKLCKQNIHYRHGLNVSGGRIAVAAVAEAHQLQSLFKEF